MYARVCVCACMRAYVYVNIMGEFALSLSAYVYTFTCEIWYSLMQVTSPTPGNLYLLTHGT